MQQSQFSLPVGKGVELYAQLWEPEGSPRAVVCLIHGLGEHCGRYGHVAKALTEAGYAMMAFDLRGHGRSPGPRGAAPSFETLLDDVGCLLDAASQRFPGLPCFLYGHSLGGILVLNFVLRRQPQLAGVVATGPALRSSLEQQSAKLLLVRILGRLLPSLSLPTGLNPRDLSRDPQVVADYVQDPLVHDRLSVGLARELLEANQWAMERACDIQVPLLLMHGEQDRLGFAQATCEFGDRVPGDCTVKVWVGLQHELHNEPEQNQVLQAIIEWLDAHLG